MREDQKISIGAPAGHRSRLSLAAGLLLLLLMPAGHAWTTEDMRQAGSEAWIVRDIRYLPQPHGAVTVSYQLTEPAFVTLRAHGLKPPFPLLKEVLSGEFRAAGAYHETWDGRDASGRPLAALKWQMVLRAEPQNFQPTENELEAALSATPVAAVLAANHRLHEPNRCATLPVHVDVAHSSLSGAQAGHVTVKWPGRYGYADRLGLGVQIFIGQVLANELRLAGDQLKKGKLEIPVDLTSVEPGHHVLRVNITDFADHYGAVSLPFIKLP